MLTAMAAVNMSSYTPEKHLEAVERPQSSSRQRPSQQDSEGMIPLHAPDPEAVYYIVDCAELHPIAGLLLYPDGYFPGSNVRHSCFYRFESKVTIVYAIV
jgi:hypothetical protein